MGLMPPDSSLTFDVAHAAEPRQQLCDLEREANFPRIRSDRNDGDHLIESALVARLEAWMTVVGQLAATVQSNDDGQYLRKFAQLSCQLVGAFGGVVEVFPDPTVDESLVESVGLDERLCRSVVYACDSGQAIPGGNDGVSVSKISDCAELQGTLLLALLEQAGVRSMYSMSIRSPAGRIVGSARFFFTTEQVPSRSCRVMVDAFAQRAVLLLEREWLARQSDAANSKMQRILEGALDAIVMADAESRIVSANPATHRMFGFSPGSLVGLPIATILPTLPEPNSGTGVVRELEALRRDGAIFPVELSASVADKVGGIICILRDITLRRAAENRMRDSDRLAMIGTLAAGLGHDMNNVLFPIRAHLNALEARRSTLTAATKTSHIAEIRGGVGYLQHLADSLHFLAMDPEADGEDGSWTDLEAWWSHTGPLLSKALHRATKFGIEIAPGLPPVSTATHALTRAVLNLLVNARESMPIDRKPTECRVSIAAQLLSDGRFVELTITDNGVGMSDEVRRRASEMFFTTKPRGLGTGLGLPLVRGVVERSGGRLEIESRVGSGTSMRMLLPAAQPNNEEALPSALLTGLEGRAMAMLGSILATHGILASVDCPEEKCTMWLCSAASLDPRAIVRWMQVHPAEAIIVIGDPVPSLAREMEAHGVLVVNDPRDISALESAVEKAVKKLKESKHV